MLQLQCVAVCVAITRSGGLGVPLKNGLRGKSLLELNCGCPMEAAISLKSDMVRFHLRILLNGVGIFLKNLQNTTNYALLRFRICDH